MSDAEIIDKIVNDEVFTKATETTARYLMSNYGSLHDFQLSPEDYDLGLLACGLCRLDRPQVAARLAEDYMTRRLYSPLDVFRVCWMIEHRREFFEPWTPNDLAQYASTVVQYIGVNMFERFLISTYFEKHVRKYYTEFMGPIFQSVVVPAESHKQVYLPIGPSACGKSTLYSNMFKWMSKVDEDELIAQNLSEEDIAGVYEELLRTGSPIYYDTVAVEKELRQDIIDRAHAHGYQVTAIVFPMSKNELAHRWKQRGTKNVSKKKSQEQYMQVELPSVGTGGFDFIKSREYRTE